MSAEMLQPESVQENIRWLKIDAQLINMIMIYYWDKSNSDHLENVL